MELCAKCSFIIGAARLPQRFARDFKGSKSAKFYSSEASYEERRLVFSASNQQPSPAMFLGMLAGHAILAAACIAVAQNPAPRRRPKRG
jgi:hypothetical protein